MIATWHEGLHKTGVRNFWKSTRGLSGGGGGGGRLYIEEKKRKEKGHADRKDRERKKREKDVALNPL